MPASNLVFFVNGEKVIDDNVDPEWTLLYYLRTKLRLTGTKLGCAEGGCGACTVMVSKYLRDKKSIIHFSLNACLAPVCGMHGLAVTTVEGIGSVAGTLHPVQERIAKAHGSQCGFCTPGIVMSMYSLLRALDRKPTMADMEAAFQGNLCRCTGYRPIIDGFKTFTEEWEYEQRINNSNKSSCGMGKLCCKNRNENGAANNGVHNGMDDSKSGESVEELFEPSSFVPLDSTQEPIFPPELITSSCYDDESLLIRGPRVSWYRPLTLDELLDLKSHYPSAKIINGNTEIGVEVKFKGAYYPILIAPSHVKEMKTISTVTEGLKVGAAVTLSDLENVLDQQINTECRSKTGVFQALVEMLHWFAGKQIRNTATIGGNIMTGSPISDLNPIFMSSKCQLELTSKERGKRTVLMDQSFWRGYRKNIVSDDEILQSILIPFTKEDQYFRAYKQARRREDDIAIVNAAFNVELDGLQIKSLSLAYGGMAPTTVLATKSASRIIGKEWSESMLYDIYTYLSEELPLQPSAPGGMASYRRTLTLSLFFKFFLHVSLKLEERGHAVNILSSYLSGKDLFQSLAPHSSQYFNIVPGEQKKSDAVGRPIVHQSAFKQATGEAVYCDDISNFEDECFLSLVLSSRPHAKLVSIDPSQALALPGVIAFFSAKDIPPEQNKFGCVVYDEEIFASSKVSCTGQVLGAVVASDPLTAQRASRLVKVQYEDLEPVIITIEDAIKNNSYYTPHHTIKRGDPENIFAAAELIIEGEVRLGGQEHFYLETNACVAVPKKEDDEIEIFSTSQDLAKIQFADGADLSYFFGLKSSLCVKSSTVAIRFGALQLSSFPYIETEIERRFSDYSNSLPLYWSVQHRMPKMSRSLVSHLLGLPCNKVICKVKRIGGGFGGKEGQTACLALPVALAAFKLKRPVRAMLDRDEDMAATGHRHPFLGKYKIAFTQDGKINACDVKMYSNAGHVTDYSLYVMQSAMFQFTNAFFIPNLVFNGYVCKTNITSNTSFRAFGSPQSMLIMETMITHVAETLKLDVDQVSEVNFHKAGNITHYNQELTYFTLDRCWNECISNSEYKLRKEQVTLFNKSNRWRKRGISLVPLMYGIAFSAPFLNQAGALVLIYQDGSVLLTHGGIEMGQGLHTKMIQVASRALGIPTDLIHISETSTDKVPNTVSTAASVSSDLNGMAIIDACNKILERLKPIKEANPKGDWNDWIKTAYLSRVSLAATGFYGTPDLCYNEEENKGRLFNYYSFGAACSEVEIDCLSGDHQVIRTDIMMDVGESLNPAIDVGQIEGAFVQGYGLYMLEELVYSPKGELYSRGPGTYKIPSFGNIPAQFNVSLLKGAPNPRAVYSSKAVGEPPLCLASSVFFAVRNAIKSAREDAGHDGYFRLDSPASAARIRMACTDEITAKFPDPDYEYLPWNITV